MNYSGEIKKHGISVVIPAFNEEKAIATASLLLKLSGGQCDKYWLNKVMYFVERESIISTGQPIFFDRLFFE